MGNLRFLWDGRRNRTEYVYDDLNRQVAEIDPLNQRREMDYDLQGNLIREQDKRGIVTEHDYDYQNRRFRTQRNGVEILFKVFDGEGNVKSTRDAQGFTTTYEYFDADLVQREVGEEASVKVFTYDNMGNRDTRRDGELKLTSWRYDLRNRKEAETNGENETTTWRYDLNGNQTQKITPKGHAWLYTYTAGNLLETVTDPATNVTTYRYDGQGNRRTVTDATQKVTTWYRDELGRPRRLVYPGGATHSYLNYDANGNLEAETDPNGQLISYTWDALNRLDDRTLLDADGAQQVFEDYTYDANNNLRSVAETDANGTRATAMAYDSFDRLSDQTDHHGETVHYEYYDNGTRKQMASSAGHNTVYTYDRRNRLKEVRNQDGTSTYRWYRNDLLKGVDYASGTAAAYTYDLANRIDTITNSHNGGEVSFYDYGFDANGNRDYLEERNGFGTEVTEYGYDDADRLAWVTYPDAREDYSFDAAWNRETEVITDRATGDITSSKLLTYNDRHQLTDITDSVDAANNVSFGYDANGNQTSKTQAGITTTYVFDVRDNLRAVTTGGSSVGQFVYDWRGMRTEKLGERGAERYTYDDTSVLFQRDASNTLQARYEYGPNQLLSLTRPNQPSEFYLFDALGSPVTLTQADGSVTARYSYNAWGEKRRESGDSFNRIGFTGHEHDNETGLIYAEARYYDPEYARFMSQDPFEGINTMPPSLHKYLYAYQNPGVYIDPDGRAAYLASGQEFDEFGAQLYQDGKYIQAGFVATASAAYRIGTGFFTLGTFDEANQAITDNDNLRDASNQFGNSLAETAKEVATEYAEEGAATALVTVGGKFACGRMRAACDTVIEQGKRFGDRLGQPVAGRRSRAVEGEASISRQAEGAPSISSESVSSSRIQKEGSRPDFYGTPDGRQVPATGYRAVGGTAVDRARGGNLNSLNDTYITFDDITSMSPEEAQSFLQLGLPPSHVAEFDTLPLIEDLEIPAYHWNTWRSDSFIIPEPITEAFPEHGVPGFANGGASQMIVDGKITDFELSELPDGK